ncbi:MAG: hypothetical protein K0S33_175 [Bacteroidetes bacterium]|jgi:hypothetical protein|nr:hypothetical protein [Bacteroidota bacterium]
MKNLIVLFVLLLAGCKSAKNTTDYAAQGYVKATVIKYEVESCGYLLQLEGEKKLMPQNLSEGFKKDGMAVWVKYETLKKQPMSTCMAGQVVTITDIKKQ